MDITVEDEQKIYDYKKDLYFYERVQEQINLAFEAEDDGIELEDHYNFRLNEIDDVYKESLVEVDYTHPKYNLYCMHNHNAAQYKQQAILALKFAIHIIKHDIC